MSHQQPQFPWLWATVLGLVTATAVANAAPPAWPAYLGSPPGLWRVDDPEVQEFAEVEMPLAGRDTPHLVRGRVFVGDTNAPGLTTETPRAEVWSIVKGLFPAPGWTVAFAETAAVTMRYRAGAVEAWARIGYGDPSDMRLTVVELAAQTRRHTLPPPASKPEALKAPADIPYLTPLPGSKLVSGGYDAVPLRVVLPGEQEETVLAMGVHERLYAGPAENISPLQVTEIYGPALREAGWTIVSEARGSFLAHYAKNGRDVWAVVGSGMGDLSFRVADAGAVDLGAQLRKDCRAKLDGVLFDFGKATLKAESTSALQRASAAIQAAPELGLEVQGHTDSVGGAADNQKLSEARARAVMTWLTTHGVPAARLTSAGYGKTRPVASNENADGRALNRRVELVCRATR